MSRPLQTLAKAYKDMLMLISRLNVFILEREENSVNLHKHPEFGGNILQRNIDDNRNLKNHIISQSTRTQYDYSKPRSQYEFSMSILNMNLECASETLVLIFRNEQLRRLNRSETYSLL